MKIEMKLTQITQAYMGDDVVAVEFEGNGSTIYRHHLYLRLTREEAKDFKVGETFTLERTK